MTNSETKQFYDEFSQNVMLKYFYQVNSRLEGVKDLCDKFIKDKAKILEVGCGVGILTRHLQRRAEHIVSLDISEAGLKIARAYADNPKTDILLLNLLENSEPLKKYGLFDAIIVADVIEHIPKEQHKKLLELLESILTPAGILILTFPNSQHQIYLSEKEPEKLQIVEEIVSVREILAATSLYLYSMNYFDADGKNKYIHLILSANIEYLSNKLTSSRKISRRMQNFVWAARNWYFLKSIQKDLSTPGS